MQSSNAPNKIALPFAASGTKNTIPVPSQQGVTPGAASFTDGFPPLTFTPLSAGGVPPAGADFNGVLNAITAVQQWQSSGGFFKYDAAQSAAIGGYPKGAMLLRADGTGFWNCTVENNTSNPDTGGAGWVSISTGTIQAGAYNLSRDTGTANAYVATLYPAPVSLSYGIKIYLSSIVASNTGPSTLRVGSGAIVPIVSMAGQPLQGGEIVAGMDARFVLNFNSQWVLLPSEGGALPVAPATQTNHAVNLAMFGSSLAANGYQKLPSGLMIQWGTQIVSANSSLVVYLPIAYQSAIYVALGTTQQSTMNYGTTQGVGVSVTNLGAIKIQNAYSASSLNIGFLTVGI